MSTALPAPLSRSIEKHASAIDSAKSRCAASVLEIGEHLHAVQQMLAGGGRDGQFAPWLEQRCGFSRSTAYRYIAAYRVFGEKCPTVGHLFDDSAIYLLSADSTPDEATELAVSRAESGERITARIAREIIDEVADAERQPEPAKPAPLEPEIVDDDEDIDDLDEPGEPPAQIAGVSYADVVGTPAAPVERDEPSGIGQYWELICEMLANEQPCVWLALSERMRDYVDNR